MPLTPLFARPLAVASFLLLLVLPTASHATEDLFCDTGSVFASHGIKVAGGSEIVSDDLDFPVETRSNQDIVVAGASLIDGAARASGRVLEKGNGMVSGDVEEGVDMLTPPDVAGLVEASRTDNDNDAILTSDLGRTAVRGTTLSLRSGDSLTIPEGDYFFTRVSVSGATLWLEGSVRFFVDGHVQMTGHSIANGGVESADFTIIGASEGSRVKLAGHGDFTGGIVLPAGSVELTGQSELFGSVVTGDLKVTGGSRLVARDACRDGTPEPPQPPTSDRCVEYDEWGECVQ